MTAQEARALMPNFEPQKNEVLSIIFKDIAKVAANGYTCVSYGYGSNDNLNLLPLVKKQVFTALGELGYSISDYEQIKSITISWD